MSIRRLSTNAFVLRASWHMENGAKVRELLNLPMVREILDTMDANEGALFFILAAVQLFKSFIGQARMLRNHTVRPAWAGWYGTSKDFVKDFAETKLNLWRDVDPAIRAIRAAGVGSKVAKLSAQFAGGGSHRLLSANIENDRTGKTLRDLYIDEAHLYDPGWLEQIRNRRNAYPEDFTETFMSTGLTVGTDAAIEWGRTNQRTWHVRCDTCKKFFAPLFLHREREDDPESPIIGGVRYQKHFQPDGLPDESAIAATLYHECPRCHDKLPDVSASRVRLSGTAESPRGEYVTANARPAPKCFGWQVSGVAVKPWLPMVVRFEKAQLARARGDIEPLLKFLREELAAVVDPEKYFRPDRRATYQHFGPLLDSEGKPVPTPYKMLEDWPGERKDPTTGKPCARLAQVDVQLDWFRLVIRKWGHFSQSRLHFTARCLSPSEIALHLAAAGVPPEHVVFDTRFDAQRIRTICSRMGWRTMMGDRKMRGYTHPDGIERIFDEPKPIDAFTGTVLQGQPAGGFVWETLFSKSAALDRLAILRDPDSKAPDGTPLHTAASDAPDWYFKEINAHYRKRVEEANGGHHNEWHGQKEDHSDDCEAMGVVVASAKGWTGAESLPAS